MAAATLSSSPSCHLFHRLLRPPPLPAPPSSILSLKPLFSSAASTASTAATLVALCLQAPLRSAALPRRFSTSLCSSHKPLPPRLSASAIHTHSVPKPEPKILDDDEYDDYDQEEDYGYDDDGGSGAESEIHLGKMELEGNVNASPRLENVKPPPSLTVKEKKEVASYAHGLGKKLKTQQVGKSGVTASVVSSFIETLEANELLKAVGSRQHKEEGEEEEEEEEELKKKKKEKKRSSRQQDAAHRQQKEEEEEEEEEKQQAVGSRTQHARSRKKNKKKKTYKGSKAQRLKDELAAGSKCSR
ncbi:uncharacterized protein LOC131156452 isoform X1 [Malania oleifera]|uniref:uncharacterized protein LOC131156452 isoform X1 n=1 Tax=Malania oleifera TaxID=397392 RepID=UPI0025AE6667|nr:uncharacterized protein LOC131156452 isoform X1 [Malania oleifera]